MAKITLRSNPINTVGELPAVNSAAPDFTLTNTEMSSVSLKDFAGKTVILNIFPSIDTPTCATSVRKFNSEAANLKNTVVLCVSMDLPFAMKRFCGAEGIDQVVTLSAFRNLEFGKNYGVTISDSPMAGLFARSIVIINSAVKVVYNQLVAEVASEPDYAAALAAASKN